MIIRRASVSIQSGRCSRERAERIARGLFHQVLSRQPDGGQAAIGRMQVPPLELSLAELDDGCIAREAAAAVVRRMRR